MPAPDHLRLALERELRKANAKLTRETPGDAKERGHRRQARAVSSPNISSAISNIVRMSAMSWEWNLIV